MPMPASRLGRMVLGTSLIVGGLLGFLPILGFWMLPLGVLVLSIDIAAVRRRRRRLTCWWLRRKREKKASRKPHKPSLLTHSPARQGVDR
jgi:hypothetical protein